MHLDDYEILSATGPACGVVEPHWPTTVQADIAAEVESEPPSTFTFSISDDGVLSGSLADGFLIVTAARTTG